MKKLLYILLFLPLLSFGQFNINKNLIKVDASGNITFPGYLYYTPAHSKIVFRDSAVTISGGTRVQITNASDSLYRELEAYGLSWLRGDTGSIITKAGYFVVVNIRGYGTNAVDWRLEIATVRGGVTTYSNQCIDFTTTGATNKNGGSSSFYMEYEAGDKTYPVLTRLGGSGDFTIETSQFNLLMYYAIP